MRLDTSMHQRMDQRMILAPRMIQSMEILQLPIMDLQARVNQELDENPALELKDPIDEEPSPDEAGPTYFEEAKSDPDGELVITDNTEIDFHRLEALARDYGDAYS